jgi:hypothetical protein
MEPVTPRSKHAKAKTSSWTIAFIVFPAEVPIQPHRASHYGHSGRRSIGLCPRLRRFRGRGAFRGCMLCPADAFGYLRHFRPRRYTGLRDRRFGAVVDAHRLDAEPIGPFDCFVASFYACHLRNRGHLYAPLDPAIRR